MAMAKVGGALIAVEAPWQRDMLMRHGCDQYQGYLFGRPVPIEAFDRDLVVV